MKFSTRMLVTGPWLAVLVKFLLLLYEESCQNGWWCTCSERGVSALAVYLVRLRVKFVRINVQKVNSVSSPEVYGGELMSAWRFMEP